MAVVRYDRKIKIPKGSWVVTDSGLTHSFAGNYGIVGGVTTNTIIVSYSEPQQTVNIRRKKKHSVQWVCDTEAEAKHMHDCSMSFTKKAEKDKKEVLGKIEEMCKTSTQQALDGLDKLK